MSERCEQQNHPCDGMGWQTMLLVYSILRRNLPVLVIHEYDSWKYFINTAEGESIPSSDNDT